MARLTAKALVNFQSINSYQYANQWIMRAGDTTTLRFQLIDQEQGAYNTIGAQIYGAPVQALSGSTGLRYIAGVQGGPVVLNVTFPSIDNKKVLTITAIPDPNDGSIFSLVIPPTSVPAGGNVIFKLVEGLNVANFGVLNMLAVEYPGNDGSDGPLPNVGC